MFNEFARSEKVETGDLDGMMECLGHVPSPEELLFMINIVDPKSTGNIFLDDFLLLMNVLNMPEDDNQFEDDTISEFKMTGMTDFANMLKA